MATDEEETKSPKRGVNVRLRDDQAEAIRSIVREDPELDRSKVVRRAVDEFLVKRRKVRYTKKKR